MGTRGHFKDPFPRVLRTFFSNSTSKPQHGQQIPRTTLPFIYRNSTLREPVYDLVKKLSVTSRKVIVIHDSLMFYVIQDVPSVPNAESYCFNSVSAFAKYAYTWEMEGKPVLVDGVSVNELLCGGRGTRFPKEWNDFRQLQHGSRKRNWGNLYNTSRVIDGEYLDLIAREGPFSAEKHWAIGPLNPLEITRYKRSEKCLEWLDKQADKSVIFVSFGSTTSLSDEQVEEIAIGLENSGQKFIWVLRDADRGDVFVGESRRANLPEGYEERVVKDGRGIIVRDWAPQLDILGHSSTGGFMSHCGWNSCIESISLGVPMIAWPMHSDQPRNAILLTKVLQTGLMVAEWGHEGEVVKADAVENAVKSLMGSGEGQEMRKRASELSDAIKKSVTRATGVTSSGTELDAFIAHVARPNDLLN